MRIWISHPEVAVMSSHIVASLGALRDGGRAVFMGGIRGNVEIPMRKYC